MKTSCDSCGKPIDTRECPSCNLYNAAVEAQYAAAGKIARDYEYSAIYSWLNEYGVWARIDGVIVQVGSPEQAAPFVALTKAVDRVTCFQPPRTRTTPRKRSPK